MAAALSPRQNWLKDIENFMRVIAGTYRSRILKSLKGPALRPTSDRLRETLFNVLGAGIAGSRFLDIFAGTGAVGIEALSRGAAEAVFIESHPPAAKLIRSNLDSLGIQSRTTVLAADALRGLEMLASKWQPRETPFAYVFLDPPYAASADYARVLGFLGSAPFLAPGSVVIAEHRRNYALPEKVGALERVRVQRQGDAALSFYRTRASHENGLSSFQ
jgi:16S rRNA (guanine966-N2)-methyltransferase